MKTNLDYTAANSGQIEQDLCDQLRKVRIARNITQQTMAHMAGVSERTIRRMEAGEGVSLDTFIRVLSALGIQENLKVIFPDVSIRPVERVRFGKERMRARPKRPDSGRGKPSWQWRDEA